MEALVNGLPKMDRRFGGRFLRDATLTGPESRGSSPVRIIREPESRQSPGIAGLYPCGEGAGYAGGIISAAVDGLRTARVIVAKYRCPVLNRETKTNGVCFNPPRHRIPLSVGVRLCELKLRRCRRRRGVIEIQGLYEKLRGRLLAAGHRELVAAALCSCRPDVQEKGHQEHFIFRVDQPRGS